MKKYILILLIFPMMLSCQKERPIQSDIIQCIKNNPLSFTESYIITKNLIQNYKSQDGKDSKAIIPVTASISATIDLSQIYKVQINDKEHIAKIILPKPTIKINLSEPSKGKSIYCTTVSRSTYFETDLENYYLQAMALMKEALIKSNISSQVQHSAAFALANIIQSSQFKNMNFQIEITKYNDKDILNFILK